MADARIPQRVGRRGRGALGAWWRPPETSPTPASKLISRGRPLPDVPLGIDARAFLTGVFRLSDPDSRTVHISSNPNA